VWGHHYVRFAEGGGGDMLSFGVTTGTSVLVEGELKQPPMGGTEALKLRSVWIGDRG
jgi:hypothetical protein